MLPQCATDICSFTSEGSWCTLSMAGKTAYSTLGVEDFVGKVSNLDEIEE